MNNRREKGCKIFIEKYKISQAWWLGPVILATQEVKLWRIAIQGQSRQKVVKTTSQPIAGCRGMHLPSQLLWEALTRRVESRLAEA
jgi:hypothetical protein